MRVIAVAATSAEDMCRAMGAFALETEGALDPAGARVASRPPRHEWPERPMIIVAVNAHTGERYR